MKFAIPSAHSMEELVLQAILKNSLCMLLETLQKITKWQCIRIKRKAKQLFHISTLHNTYVHVVYSKCTSRNFSCDKKIITICFYSKLFYNYTSKVQNNTKYV